MPNTKTKTNAKGKTTPKAKAAPNSKGTIKHNPKQGLRAVPTAVGQYRTKYSEAATITLQGQWAKANPKQLGSGAHNRFAVYLALAKRLGNGRFTVAHVLNGGVQPSDVKYNVTHGYVVLGTAKVKGAKATTKANAKATTKANAKATKATTATATPATK